MKKKRRIKQTQKLSDVAEEFIEFTKQKNLSSVSIHTYEYMCGVFISAIGDIEVNKMNQDVLDEFRGWLENNRNCNAVSKNTIFNTLNVFLGFLYEKNYIFTELKFKFIKVDRKIKDIYTDTELKILLKKPDEDCLFAEYRNYVMTHMVLNLALRVRTLSEIRVEDIDMKEKIITLHALKNRQEVIMKIPQPLHRVLKEYFEDYEFNDSDYLICDAKGGKMKTGSISKAYKRYCQNRGVFKDGSVHLLRHTYSARFMKSGGNIYALSKILGHSNVAITENYLRSLGVNDFIDDLERFNPAIGLKG